MKSRLPSRLPWTGACLVLVSMIWVAGCARRQPVAMPGVYDQLRQEQAMPSGYVRPPDELEAPVTAGDEAGAAHDPGQEQPGAHEHMHHGGTK